MRQSEGITKAPVALVTGSLPPEVCGVGDYTSRLHAELSKIAPVDLVHIPIRKVFEKSLFSVFKGRNLVHVEYPTEGWGNSLLPSLLPLTQGRSKLLLTLHEWSQMNRLRRASLLPVISRADGFIFVSERERAAFRATAPPPARRKPTWVIPIGVNLEVPALEPNEVCAFRAGVLKEHDRLITHFGFIHAGKQPEKLLDAMTALLESGEWPKLVFVGDFQHDKTAEREAFIQQIQDRGLTQVVELKGFVHDEREAALYMAASDLSISLFSDGLSPRRGSFWYGTQHGCALLTTEPEDWSDFGEAQKYLRPPHVQFVPADVSGARIAIRIVGLPPYEPFRYPRVPVPTWREIAEKHRQVYEELRGRE